MKVKVGQWVRNSNGLIDNVKRIIVHNKLGEYLDCGNRGIFEYLNLDLKVANDPRELIEVGDLVKDKTKRGSVLEINRIDINSLGARFLYSFGTPILFGNITEIWTKIDKDTYKCQWRKENE